MKNLIASIWVLAIIIGVSSCGGSTYMVDSWSAPNETIQKGDLNKVMVAVLSNSETSRRRAEDEIASYNSMFTPSYKVLGTQQMALDTAKSKSVLKSQNYDAVLLMRLRDKNETQTWVPGNTYNYWGYHGMYYGAYYDPGYVRNDVSYTIETNLFSIKDNKLLWSGITSSMNPTSLETTVDEVVKEVYQRMKKDGLIPEEAQETKQ